MKKILALIIFFSFSSVFAFELQDTTKNQNKEKEQLRVQEENQQKNQGEENQAKDKNRNGQEIQKPNNGNVKGKKDVFIDKDGDGIADTRASGMSFNKVRKRTKAGQQGSGGQGGSGGNGGGK
jgi:hypothetical protein